VPNRPGVPWRVAKHTVMDLDEWPYPKAPLVPLAESVQERRREITAQELGALLSGIDLDQAKRRKRYRRSA